MLLLIAAILIPVQPAINAARASIAAQDEPTLTSEIIAKLQAGQIAAALDKARAAVEQFPTRLNFINCSVRRSPRKG
jgi:hypothetical protein